MSAEEKPNQQPDLGRWLDRALRARVEAEPRMGLEDRVLARLASEPQPKVFTWRPVLGAIAGVVAIAFVLTILRPDEPRRNLANGIPQPAKLSQSAGNEASSRAPRAALAGNIEQQKQSPVAARKDLRLGGMPSSRTALASRTIKHGQLPKLAAFPAQRPETTEERMLARLAAQGGHFDVAELQDVSVPQFRVQPMEETPSDDTPQE